MGPETNDPEIVCQSQLGGVITSGGGFSTYFAQPSWQTSAVNKYFADLTTSNTPTSGYNALGRGYPDMSLIGVNYQVYVSGAIVGLYGTSCTAPVTAAYVSLVNADRLSRGLGSVGWLNPTLWAVGYNNSMGLGNIYDCLLYTSDAADE